jgi:hypothetical protein
LIQETSESEIDDKSPNSSSSDLKNNNNSESSESSEEVSSEEECNRRLKDKMDISQIEETSDSETDEISPRSDAFSEKKSSKNKRKNDDNVSDQSFQFNENCAGVSVMNSTPKKISEKESWKGKVFVVSKK